MSGGPGAAVPAGLVDLHRHLDGSLRAETLRELARAEGVELPPRLRFHAGMGLDAALELFRMTLAVLQSPPAVRRVAAEICADAEREGVAVLEIRFAPQLHRGAAIESVVDAALDGIGGRAGLILCALYGEPPELVEKLVDIAAPRRGVVGIDLAGAPGPDRRWGMRDYRSAFGAARRIGLGRTVHASEGRPPAEIRDAVELLAAQRIGHGTTLLEDREVLDLVLERAVVLEACPTSNLHTGAVPEHAAHPLPHWLDRGVQACINTDNTLFSEVDAPTEYRRAADLPGMTAEKLTACLATGRSAAFRRG